MKFEWFKVSRKKKKKKKKKTSVNFEIWVTLGQSQRMTLTFDIHVIIQLNASTQLWNYKLQ